MVTTSSTGAGSGSSPQPSLEHYASQFLQKIYGNGNDTRPADQYTIPPYLRFPFDIDHDVAVEIVQPFIGPLAHGTHEASVPLVLPVNMGGSYCTEDRDLADPQAQTLDTIEDTGPNAAVAIDSRLAWLSFHRHAGAFSQLTSSLSLETLDGSAESHQVVTPTLQDPKDSHRESTNFSQVPSPYTPMPLPPIFSFESQPKMMDITIDAASSSHSPFCPVQDDKCFPIDPAQASYTEPAPAVDADNTFARGRTRSECLWPPSLSVEYQLPKRCPKTVSNATGISLDVAERQAEEFRAIGPSTLLSLSFLMTFMGQPTEHSPWQCYIRGCGKTLTRKSHMVDHIRMHLNERVYACDTCPQTFLRKADCKRHALAHNPDKAFRCNSCPKSFGRKDLLTRHSRGCKPNNEWVPSNDLKEQRSKRTETQRTSILDTTGAQDDMAFIASNILLSPPEGFKNGGKRTLGFHGEDKENIPPFLLPSGPTFSHLCGADPEGKRKKARTRI